MSVEVSDRRRALNWTQCVWGEGLVREGGWPQSDGSAVVVIPTVNITCLFS